MFCCLELVSCRLAVATDCRLELQPVVTNIPKCEYKEKEKEADRRRGGKTISKSGQKSSLPAQIGQLKTGEDGTGLLVPGQPSMVMG